MRIEGIQPQNPEGEAFPIDRDGWRALLYVLHLAGGPVPAEHAEAFEGLPDQDEAIALAHRLERFLDTHTDNLFVRRTDEERQSPSGRFPDNPDLDRPAGPPPGISRERVEDFIAFLRDSGGFRVAG